MAMQAEKGPEEGEAEEDGAEEVEESRREEAPIKSSAVAEA